ncbi:ATP-binding protein [Sphaerimonospora thailandensis]|uniref:ATP-binding protein n=1 Tax=Sphaerimonospora thailandensis TaxID=795644 RepID=UPI001951108D|nr:ATP-binding protein [Sphaerimonospora thailandensis]
MIGQPFDPSFNDVTSALEMLAHMGLSNPSQELRNGVAVSLVHSSYLYENRERLPGVTQGLLNALNRLGGEFIHRLATIETYRGQAAPTSASISRGVAQIISTLPSWAAKEGWLRNSAALGRGAEMEGLSGRSAAQLCRQLIGVLALAGEGAVAARMVTKFISIVSTKQLDNVDDPKTVLQEHLPGGLPEIQYFRDGPDHDTAFQAVIKDSRGRRGIGTGKSKKLASQQAALDFLQKYYPAAIVSRNRTATQDRESAVRRPLEIQHPRRHALLVERVQKLFELPQAARPLLSQALIHASWAYENKSSISAANQQDNQALARIGSIALSYEHVLATVQGLITDPPEEISLLTISNDVYNEAFRQVGLSSGLLLGIGQASLAIPIDMGSNTFQALIAAIYVAKGFPSTLAECWPREWQPIWSLIAQREPSLDPTTLLQRATAAMKMETAYDFLMAGPDHQGRFKATIALYSPTLNVRTALSAEEVMAGGKTKAKHNAALPILEVLEKLADERPALSMAGCSESERSLARFLLAHQFSVLTTPPAPIQRWINAKFFGLHLASSPKNLLKWALEVDQLLGLRINLQPNNYLRDAFKGALDKSDTSTDVLGSLLIHTLDTLEQVDEPEDISSGTLMQLVQLCNVYRCLGTEDPNISLSDLITDWSFLYHRRLRIKNPTPELEVSGRERAVLDAALTAALDHGETTEVEVLSFRPFHLRFHINTPIKESSLEQLCALWSTVSKTTRMTTAARSIDVIIEQFDLPAEPGPVTQAVINALTPRPEQYPGAVADLLHDLKNQLVAARSAASQTAENRTARLQRQLTASRHLDQAHALALRLRATRSMLRPAGNESLELGTFLRQYAASVLTRLPSAISLSVPESKSVVRVPMDGRAFTAILDNLIGNAIEALPDGGSITLDWTADDYEAAVEIADNGPGIPPEVLAAFRSGERIRSTKPGGNGLGLFGVRALLSLVGGQLTPVAANTGTAWLITLPITEETES